MKTAARIANPVDHARPATPGRGVILIERMLNYSRPAFTRQGPAFLSTIRELQATFMSDRARSFRLRRNPADRAGGQRQPGRGVTHSLGRHPKNPGVGLCASSQMKLRSVRSEFANGPAAVLPAINLPAVRAIGCGAPSFGRRPLPASHWPRVAGRPLGQHPHLCRFFSPGLLRRNHRLARAPIVLRFGEKTAGGVGESGWSRRAILPVRLCFCPAADVRVRPRGRR